MSGLRIDEGTIASLNEGKDPRKRRLVEYHLDRYNAYDDLISQAASEFGENPKLIKTIMLIETGMQPNQVSHKGYSGYAQTNEATIETVNNNMGTSFTIEDMEDPLEASRFVAANIQYLRRKQGAQNDDEVFVAYNTGPGKLEDFRSGKLNPESRQYLHMGNHLMNSYNRPIDLNYSPKGYREASPDATRINIPKTTYNTNYANYPENPNLSIPTSGEVNTFAPKLEGSKLNQRFYNTMPPLAYPSTKEYVRQGVNFIKGTKAEQLSSKLDREIFGYALGVLPKEAMTEWEDSPYKPTIAKDPNAEYLRMNRKYISPQQMSASIDYMKSNNIDKTTFVNEHWMDPDAYKEFGESWGPMARHQVSMGSDEMGDYLSLYDKWDLTPLSNIFLKRKPEIYDRFYYKENPEYLTNKNRRYLDSLYNRVKELEKKSLDLNYFSPEYEQNQKETGKTYGLLQEAENLEIPSKYNIFATGGEMEDPDRINNYERGFTYGEAQKFPEEIKKKYKLDYPIKFENGGKFRDFMHKKAGVPLAVNQFVYDLLGGNAPITEESLGSKELELLRQIVRKNLSKGEKSIRYGDYAPPFSKDEEIIYNAYRGGIKDNLKALISPAHNLNYLLGQAQININNKDTTVVDNYDFDSRNTPKEFFNNLLRGDYDSPYKILENFGHTFGSKSGEGSPVRINISQKGNGGKLNSFEGGGDLTAKRDVTNINPLSIISKEDLEEYYRTQSGEPSYQQFRLNRSKAEEIQKQNQNLMSKGQTRVGNAITDLGTGILTWGTEFRPPTDYELERNRYSADKGFFGTQYDRARSIARAGSWGLADIMTGAVMSGIGKPNRFATNFVPSKFTTEVVDLPEDILKKIKDNNKTLSGEFNFTPRKDALNKEIARSADAYIEAITSEVNRARLEEFDEIYGTKLAQRLDPWVDIIKNAEQISKNSKIQIGFPQSFSKDELGINIINWSPKDSKAVFNNPSGKFDNLPVTKNTRTSILNPKLHKEDIPTVVWHELSHDFNDVGNFFYSHTDINKSSQLIDDLKKVFKTPSKVNLKDAAEAKNAYVYKTYSSGNIPLDYTDVPIEDIIKREFNYITSPTETWAFLSTNLKQDLVREGYIKNYLDPINKSILERVKNGKNTIYSRFEPYIGDEDQFIKMFNRVGLGTIPAAVGAKTLTGKDNKFQ